MGQRAELLRDLAQYIKDDPSRLRKLARTGAGKVRYFVKPPARGAWVPGPAGWDSRSYQSYDDYVVHQRSKLMIVDLSGYDRDFHAALVARLGKHEWSGQRVLCLAARIGTEVRAFIDAGALAVGVDLNPGPGNKYVVVGDFHGLQYAPGSFDVVFTNSLDHSLELSRLLSEVRRVLVVKGRFIVEATEGGERFDEWAVAGWPSIDGLSAAVCAADFREVSREPISIPWTGYQITFRAS